MGHTVPGDRTGSVWRTYRLDEKGSKYSLLPSICDVDVVGIGATSRLFRTPCSITSRRSFVQSHVAVVGVSPSHRSNWNDPLLIGEPWNDSYGPYPFSSSIEAVHAEK